MKKIDISTRTYPSTFALVDDDDFERLNRYKWRYSNGYAVRWSTGNEYVSMHHEVFAVPKGMVSDHIDGNRLNNCKINLRSCTATQNQQNRAKHGNNTSGYKGVSWNKVYRKWSVGIQSDGKTHYLGRFNCLIKAAKTYDKAARKYHGEFARLNFPHSLIKNGE